MPDLECALFVWIYELHCYKLVIQLGLHHVPMGVYLIALAHCRIFPSTNTRINTESKRMCNACKVSRPARQPKLLARSRVTTEQTDGQTDGRTDIVNRVSYSHKLAALWDGLASALVSVLHTRWKHSNKRNRPIATDDTASSTTHTNTQHTLCWQLLRQLPPPPPQRIGIKGTPKVIEHSQRPLMCFYALCLRMGVCRGADFVCAQFSVSLFSGAKSVSFCSVNTNTKPHTYTQKLRPTQILMHIWTYTRV